MTTSRAAALSFVLSMVGSLGLILVYLFGGQTQLEGVFLGLALGGLGLGIVVWSLFLMNVPVESDERKPLASAPETPAAPAGTVLATEEVTRRRFLVRLLVGATAVLAAALALPTLSLGPRPGATLFRSAWARGMRIVSGDGDALRPEDVALGTVTTVFPQDHPGSADAVALLIRVRPEDLQLPDGRGDWAPQGYVVYSKICTHAGCPVGLYRAEQQQLLCPCHQSSFDVLRGAVPTFGPAARPLPQLPVEVDDEGYLVAAGDFPEPVGPSFWNLTHDRGEEAGA